MVCFRYITVNTLRKDGNTTTTTTTTTTNNNNNKLTLSIKYPKYT
jgi:hypothetical protein